MSETLIRPSGNSSTGNANEIAALPITVVSGDNHADVSDYDPLFDEILGSIEHPLEESPSSG